jgi:hypothetical protein
VSRRKRKTKPRWLWAAGALFGAVITYVIMHGMRRPAAIPVPGEAARADRASPAPREEIHDSERRSLDKLLDEHARSR